MTVAPLNGTLRKNRRSSSGSARRGSYASSGDQRDERPGPPRTSVGAEDQPARGDSMMAKVSPPSSAMTSSWPTGSGRRARAARDSGTNSAVSTIAASPIGTLIQKIARQSTASIRAPPTSGPRPMRQPDHPAPHADGLRTLARVGERRW